MLTFKQSIKQSAIQPLDDEHATRMQQSHLVYTTKPSFSLFPFSRGSKKATTIYETKGA
jgi:hypothetical protein